MQFFLMTSDCQVVMTSSDEELLIQIRLAAPTDLRHRTFIADERQVPLVQQPLPRG